MVVTYLLPHWCEPEELSKYPYARAHILDVNNQPYCKNGGLDRTNYNLYCGCVPESSICKTCFKRSLFDRATST